jgi:DNA-binding beta-propeller fold protein YncE
MKMYNCLKPILYEGYVPHRHAAWILRTISVFVATVCMNDAVAEPPPAFVLSWGGRPSSDPGGLYSPSAVDIAPNGTICVLEAGNHRIQFFTSAGEHISLWAAGGGLDLEISPTGEIYVADTGNNRVQRFSMSGTLIQEWGSFGANEGEFDTPRGIATDREGFVYVSDHGNSRIQKFDASGKFILAWGKHGEDKGEFGSVEGLAVDDLGHLFAADGWGEVQKFDLEGNFVAQIGSYGGMNPPDGEFYRAEDLDVDKNGNLFVLDRWARRVQKFDSNGMFLSKFGLPGDDDGQFCNPTGIAVSQDGETIYVTDDCETWEPHQYYEYLARVEKFEYGTTPVHPLTWGRLKSRYTPLSGH